MFLGLLVGLACLAPAATVEGTVYDFPTLEPVEGVVEVNSTPRQTVVARNGTYSLELPLGYYLLTAKVFRREGDRLVLSAQTEENLMLSQEGRFRVDLILSPLLEEVPLFQLPDFPDENVTEGGEQLEPPSEPPWPLLIGGGLAALLALAYLLARARGPKAPQPPLQPPSLEAPRPMAAREPTADERRVIEALAQNDGRLGQKELRKLLGWSEAKASLVVSELEDLGRVRRIRKGRGNIVRLERPAG